MRHKNDHGEWMSGCGDGMPPGESDYEGEPIEHKNEDGMETQIFQAAKLFEQFLISVMADGTHREYKDRDTFLRSAFERFMEDIEIIEEATKDDKKLCPYCKNWTADFGRSGVSAVPPEFHLDCWNRAREQMIEMVEFDVSVFMNGDPDTTAKHWLSLLFTPIEALEWRRIGCWNPAIAANLRNFDCDPKSIEMASAEMAERASKGSYTGNSPIHAACTGDLDVLILIAHSQGMKK